MISPAGKITAVQCVQLLNRNPAAIEKARAMIMPALNYNVLLWKLSFYNFLYNYSTISS